MKVGIVGIGYWGKIVFKTLKFLGVKDVTICDPTLTGQTDYESHPVVTDYKELTMIFVLISCFKVLMCFVKSH
jgi:phosphoglycerate dehydrogenase-like enzyme